MYIVVFDDHSIKNDIAYFYESGKDATVDCSLMGGGTMIFKTTAGWYYRYIPASQLVAV